MILKLVTGATFGFPILLQWDDDAGRTCIAPGKLCTGDRRLGTVGWGLAAGSGSTGLAAGSGSTGLAAGSGSEEGCPVDGAQVIKGVKGPTSRTLRERLLPPKLPIQRGDEKWQDFYHVKERCLKSTE